MNSIFANNGSALLRHSVGWLAASFFMLLEMYVFGGLLFAWLPKISSSFVYALEVSVLCLALANALYCFVSYLSLLYGNAKTDLFTGSVGSIDPNKSEQNISANRANCVKSLCAFMGNYFKQPVSVSKETSSTSFLSSFSDLDARSSSLSSLVGYHDSPLNKTVSSIHSRSQLQNIIDNETCDSVIDSIDCSPFFDYNLPASNWYQLGTSQQPLSTENSDALNAIKSFTSDESAKYQRRPDKRIFQRKRSPSLSKIYTESDITEILKIYQLDKQNLELYEIKLRIWICNTIIKPLVAKIEETNRLLEEKYLSLHLKIGSTNLDGVQSALMHKQDLCKTFIPFLLPYLRIHSNQPYIVGRIQALGRNIAIEEFKWNGGGDQTIRNEDNSYGCLVSWNEQMPTDSELIWHLFSTYMDFHLSPSSETVSAVTELNKPFTNAFFAKFDEKMPSAFLEGFISAQQQDRQMTDKFFIRMKSQRPPIFELVVDSGETVLLPDKDGSQNLWLILTLFLAHVKKVARSRIGHLHLASLSLDIFDL